MREPSIFESALQDIERRIAEKHARIIEMHQDIILMQQEVQHILNEAAEAAAAKAARDEAKRTPVVD